MPGAHLTEADFKVIGTMTQLENLTCNGSNLHDKDLLALAPLHHLYKLDLPGNHLTAAAIPVLKAMFKDHKANLDIRSDNIKRDDSQRIEKALPAVVFDHSGPDFFSDIAKDIKAHPPPFDSEIK